MVRWIHRLAASGLLMSQLVLTTVVPAADARLERESLVVHASATSHGLHDSHPTHDHRLCDLCRALSVFAGPAPAPERIARALDERSLLAVTANDRRPGRAHFLPVGSRAPPRA